MELNRPQNRMLLGFVTLSLLLHLALLWLVPQKRLLSVPAPEAPVVVEVRPPQPRDRELDLPLPEVETPRTTPAKRLGPADQTVQKETAPKGDMPEDRTVSAPSPPAASAKPQPVQVQPPQPAETRPATERPGPAATAAETPRPLPDVRTLLASADRAAQNVAERQVAEWRRKYRADVEEGDAVWLDTEKDILISFFQRFRDNIYGVWNYPPRAAERREEGTCLLKVTVNRDGSVRDVELKETSGHSALDREAVAAVWKGEPYGRLSRLYEEETLTIFAFFQYNLTRATSRRPGDIY